MDSSMADLTPENHRFFHNSQESLIGFDPHQELLASLERINISNAPVHTCSTGWNFHGFYTGPTSIAYLFYRLSQLYPDLEFKHQSLLDWAQEYLDLGSQVKNKDPTPSNCGIANETLAHLALSAVIINDLSLVKKLCSYEPVINSIEDDGSNEWLYGRAGWLYLLRLCGSFLKDDSKSDVAALLAVTTEKTVQRILSVPRPWIWHGKQYLGAAHGTIGIICQVVLSMPSAARQLQDPLSDILGKQFESGNFPSSLPAGSDKLVQFCHGAAGFVLSLQSILVHFPLMEAKIQMAIQRAQADIWKRGILRKEPCLCHGIASNALALGTNEQFRVYLSFMCTPSTEHFGWMRKIGRSDEVASLYTGEAGRAWVWAVADRRLPRTCIGFNDL